jgi:competence CoiA-like predicted nuclease
MLTAIRQSDNLKVLGNQIDKNLSETYTCDFCKKVVIHHKSDSRIKVGHFKHKTGESHCPNNFPETEYHLNTKIDIYNYIKESWGDKLKCLEIEKWVCNNSARADVYIETNRNKIAIEVQATILTVSEIKSRTEKYYSSNIYVLWILPYDYQRLHRYILNRNNEYDWFFQDKVKLKDMEVFLYWSNKQRLIFWDLNHKYYDTFVCTFFTEHKNDDVDFWRDGEQHLYSGRTSKTIKTPTSEIEVSFDKMLPKHYKTTQAQNRTYEIPDRKVFTYDRS